jgi:glycine dehydrogenase subunit 2
LIEPTETESKQDLEAFAAALIEICDQARADPEVIKAAPVNLPVRRLDDVRAARQLDLSWHTAG